MSEKIIDVEAPSQHAQQQSIVLREQGNVAVDRPLTLDEVAKQLDFIRQVMKQEMQEGQDYGKIPGCGDKPGLFQPGAQKLCLTFRLTPKVSREMLRDLGNHHREYEFTVTLHSAAGREWDGVGTCSTMESKYRYRQGERSCPNCGKKTIIKGKAEYGGGWICFSKKGGCGAKWADGAKEIESQNVGKIEHDNPADFWNTVRKMAFKRALVHAAINATNTSELWSQDLEDLPIGASVSDSGEAEPQQSKPKPAPAAKTGNGNNGEKLKQFLEECRAKLIGLVDKDKLFKLAVLKRWISDLEAVEDIPVKDLFPSVDWDQGVEHNKQRARKDYDDLTLMVGKEVPAPADGASDAPGAAEADYAAESEPAADPDAKVFFGKIECVITKKGTSKRGPWTRYGIKSGTEQNPIWFNTFSDSLGKLAMSLDKKQAKLTYTAGEQGNDLQNVEPV